MMLLSYRKPGRLLILGFLLAVVALPALGQTARGVVFNDANRNGIRDRGERGVPGVGVSNGRDVVVTDRRGRYEIEVGDNTALFIIRPSGWAVPVDDNNLPRFHYLHYPQGSPEMKYPGVAPTGPLPESIDFPLWKERQPNRFRAIFMGDTQVRNEAEVAYLSHDILKDLVGVDAAFGVTLGDIVFDDLSMFEPIVEAVGTVGVPWYNVIGNHDYNQDIAGDEHTDGAYTRVFGPPYYAFNYGKVHFISLDSVYWEDGGYRGELGPDQVAFLRNNLALVPEDRLVVVMMHIPVVSLEDKQAVYDALARFDNRLVVAAHWHVQFHAFLGEEEGWPGEEPLHMLLHNTACGSWWAGAKDEKGIPHAMMQDGSPNGYSFINFDGNEYSIDFRAARRPSDYQMSIHAPDQVARGETATLVVNFFVGHENDEVTARVGDGPARTLAWTPMEDPYFLALKDLEPKLPPEAGRKLPGPRKSQHIWSGDLTFDVPPGAHVIHVEATDIFGKIYHDRRVIRVR